MIHTLGFSPSLDMTYRVPTITVGAIHRPTAVLRLAGGKSLNVSRALAQLGYPVRAIVPLGGLIGDLVAELLPTEIQLMRMVSAQSTRLCVSAADDSGHSLTEFYEPAPALDLDVLNVALDHVLAVPPGDWLTLSGQVPSGIDTDTLGQVLNTATSRGVRLAVDVHGPALKMIIDQTSPELVKINRDEATELVCDDLDDRRSISELVDLGQRVLGLGCRAVIITDGVEGSLGLRGSGDGWRARTDAPAGDYPVGSGDSFLAGLVSKLSGGSGMPEALLTAAAVASANAHCPGGAVFDLAVVESMRRATRVTPLA